MRSDLEQHLQSLYRRGFGPPPDPTAVLARLAPHLNDVSPAGTTPSPSAPPTWAATGPHRPGYLSVAAVVLVALASAILFAEFGPGLRAGPGGSVPTETSRTPAPAGALRVMLTKVRMLSTSAGWAIGGGTILQYGQGRWTVATTVPHATLTGLSMDSPDDGWAVGYSDSPPAGVMLHYSQGRWIRVANPPILQANEQVADIAMLSASEGWAGSYAADGSGYILHDRGGQWTRITVRDAQGFPVGIHSIDMLSPTEGWATVLGGSRSNSFLHYSGGQWTVVDAPNPGPTGLSMASATEGWAVGFNGPTGDTILVHCTNGQWTVIPPAVADQVGGARLHGLFGVSMLSLSEGWAVGNQGVILHYRNGTWTRVRSPTARPLYDVQMVSAGEGWAVGDQGVILHDQDGSWSVQSGP